jgi:hypothetical protein
MGSVARPTILHSVVGKPSQVRAARMIERGAKTRVLEALQGGACSMFPVGRAGGEVRASKSCQINKVISISADYVT